MSHKIVILTRDGLEHRFVAHSMCSHFDVDAIIVDVAPPTPMMKRLRRHGGLTAASRCGRRLILKALRDDAARDSAYQTVFGLDADSTFPSHTVLHRVANINSETARSILKQIAPDLLVVYGTRIVREPTLRCASQLSINLHTGMSPHYRGTQSPFWALHNREPELVGATVHECTAELDGGRIYARQMASLAPDDGLHESFARCVCVGADLLVAVVKQHLEGTLEGLPQDLHQGREYRAADQTIGAELRVRRLIRKGLIRKHVASTPSRPLAREHSAIQ